MKKIMFLVLILGSNGIALQAPYFSHKSLSKENNQLNTVNIASAINLNQLILNKNFFVIKTNGLVTPSSDQILTAAKKLNINPKINWAKIGVLEDSITSTSATLISLDNNVYTGQVNIIYTLDISAKLSDLITTRNLGSISLNSENYKTDLKESIFNKIKNLNKKNIDWTKIEIDDKSITATGAEVISTDTTIYSGSIDISFNLNISQSLNLKDEEEFSGTASCNDIVSATYIIFNNWTDFASNWESFTNKFPSLSFDSSSYIQARTVDGTCTKNNISLKMTNITSEITSQITASQHNSQFLWCADIDVNINIWHDDHNIYLNTSMSTQASFGTESLYGTVNLLNINFLLSSIS